MSCTSNLGIRTRSVQCIGGQICNKLLRPHNTETCFSNVVTCTPQADTSNEPSDIFADIEITLNRTLPLLHEPNTSLTTQETVPSGQDGFFADLFVKIVKLMNKTSPAAPVIMVTGPIGAAVALDSSSLSAAFGAPKSSNENILHKNSTAKRKKWPKRDIVIDLNDEAISSMIANNENGTISETYLIGLLKMRMNGTGLTTTRSTGLTTTSTKRLTTFDMDSLINRLKDQKLDYEWETGVFGSVNCFVEKCEASFRQIQLECPFPVFQAMWRWVQNPESSL